MNSTHILSAAEQPLLDIPQILGALWRRKWSIVASVLVMLAIAIGYISVTRPTFTSNAVLLIDPREAKTTATPNVISGLGQDSAAISSQVAVISSTEALKSVFDAEKLVGDPEYTRPDLISSVLQLVRSGEQADPERVAFEKFRKKLTVDREGLTYILNVRFASEDPVKSARIANAVVDRYITGQVTEKTDVSAEITGLLNDRIVKLRDAVSSSEQAVEDFKAANDIVSLDAGRTLLTTQIEQVNSQWLQAQESARAATNRYDQAKGIGTSPAGLARLTEILSSNSAEQLRNTYNLRVAALARAKSDLGPKHPLRVSLEAEVSHLGSLMRTEAERIIEELRAEKDLAATNSKTIERELKDLRGKLERSNQLAVQLRQLERNADSSRKVLEEFLGRSKETSQLGELQRSDARVLSSATPPLKPTWPRPLLVLAVAGALGFLIGCVIALSKERRALMASYAAAITGATGAAAAVAPIRETRLRPAPQPVSAPRPQPLRPPSGDLAAATVPTMSGGVQEHALHMRHARPTGDGADLAYLRSLRSEIQNYPHDRFASELRCLMFTFVEEPPVRNRTVVCQITSSCDEIETAGLAYALALEMQRNSFRPLIVHLDPATATGGVRLDAVLAGNARIEIDDLVDPQTGIATIESGGQHPAMVRVDWTDRLRERIFDELGGAFDAIFLVDRSMADLDEAISLSDIVDRQLILLRTNEDRSAALALARDSQAAGTAVDLVTVYYSEKVRTWSEAPAGGRRIDHNARSRRFPLYPKPV